MNHVRCPFCHWYRLADPSKGAPPFDADKAQRELVDHLHREHDEWWHYFLDTYNR